MPVAPAILVVDDEPALCNILKKHLTKAGYPVLTASNGREALRIIKTEEVQLLILDVKMPGMSGFELLKMIRRIKRVQLPAVIMTAYGSPSSAREAMELGAVDYLTKPFDLNQMTSIVREALLKRGGLKAARKLLYVPILHTVNDMGTLAGSMKETYVRKFGEKKWHQHVRAIDEMWEGIRAKIQRLNLPYEKVRVYQDGLPVCGKEREIVEDLAKQGSPNHKLVWSVLKRGAALMGTEDPKLLVKEYHHYKKIMSSKNHGEREKLVHQFEKEESELLRKRDQFIRHRIALTLQEGETGLLFMGLLHRVDEHLPSDIKVSYLIDRLPFRRSFEIELVA